MSLKHLPFGAECWLYGGLVFGLGLIAVTVESELYRDPSHQNGKLPFMFGMKGSFSLMLSNQ